jgi:hypothetical protein
MESSELPYQTPSALRAALASKFANIAQVDGRYTAAELHRQFAYDRLLARIFSSAPDEWVLKGAGGLLARLETGRHTKDIDLYWLGQSRRLDEAEEAYAALPASTWATSSLSRPDPASSCQWAPVARSGCRCAPHSARRSSPASTSTLSLAWS